MTEATAITLAIAAIELQIKSLAIDANLVDIWSIPQPTELGVENYRTPHRIAASEKRKQLQQAITTLQQLRPVQEAFV